MFDSVKKVFYFCNKADDNFIDKIWHQQTGELFYPKTKKIMVWWKVVFDRATFNLMEMVADDKKLKNGLIFE